MQSDVQQLTKIELQAAFADVDLKILNITAIMPRLSNGQFAAALDRVCELRTLRLELRGKLAALES